jgi:hypothetical protein
LSGAQATRHLHERHASELGEQGLALAIGERLRDGPTQDRQERAAQGLQRGAHGLTDTHKQQLNEDLLAFLK